MAIINSKKGKIIEFLVALSLILIGVVMRILPHQPNFTPLAAMALFGGVYFSRRLALIIPMAAMFVSDIFIGFYDIRLMLFVYASFLLCVLLGFWLKKNKKWYTVIGTAAAGSLLFFLITNFAVWFLTPWYEKSLAGIIQCYFMALPFFRNTLSGDLFYVTVLFGTYELIALFVREKLSVAKKIVSS